MTHCIKSKENHSMMLKLSDKEFKLTITITTKFQRAITNFLETDEKIENLSKKISYGKELNGNLLTEKCPKNLKLA